MGAVNVLIESLRFTSLSLPLPTMLTAPANPPRMTMGAPRKRRASFSTGSTPLERQKYALDALGICSPAQLQYADGLRDARSTREPDKTRSPRRHAAQPEPDDPMRDTIIPPKVFGMSRFKDDGGQHRDSERPQHRATGASL
ncbi:hypothetical protein CYLTODRAFT_460383 [Cylindrobasidium torrendii FP15055 ss-10]|uniref:Uncharacterized protein n=1 Tax=Cylindrobasidium torrendii FP15055 ss-10 TaxID=1314674 RepID=A0A0D7AU56_9AGAR|nr:hypothetical protein CYLTODRAFT_460383 [Cylindrobasidium torrendii FP15055 ss-10]